MIFKCIKDFNIAGITGKVGEYWELDCYEAPYVVICRMDDSAVLYLMIPFLDEHFEEAKGDGKQYLYT